MYKMEIEESLSDGKSHFDSHADTCAGGSNFVMLDHPDNVKNHVDVAPFSEEYEPITGIPVATCATCYTALEKGETYILVFHQMLYFGENYLTAFSVQTKSGIREMSLRIAQDNTARTLVMV